MTIGASQLKIRTPLRLQLQAQAKLKMQELGLSATPSFAEYQFAPARYIEEKLGWTPWQGDATNPGQVEVLDAYTLALRQQFERRAFEHGELREDQLATWAPGQVIQNRIRVEAGHGVGKTKEASGIVSHFIDCFPPAIVYTFAPSWKQVKNLLWKEIRTDREGRGLPGRVLENCEIRIGPNHFAQGTAASNAGGHGSERVQGQHGPYLLFLIDEAEGVADFVFDAIDSMASGGIVIVLMLANPKTRISRFHKLKSHSNVRSFRMSCIYHPNVTQDREVIPGAVRRDYVETMIEKHCEVMPQHNPDTHTFEVPWRPGVIYKPNAEFMFRVLGQAPANSAHDTLIPTGRYEAARARGRGYAGTHEPHKARIGVDAARWGRDYGTVYIKHNGAIWRDSIIEQQDSIEYFRRIKAAALKLPASVWSLHIRLDGGGGYASGAIDLLRRDPDLRRRFKDFQVLEVLFNGRPSDPSLYADLATEMYATTAEVLKDAALIDPPEALEADLCERTYKWTLNGQQDVKRLTDKQQFFKWFGRSPDDGDGLVLTAAPDYVFANSRSGGGGVRQSNYRED